MLKRLLYLFYYLKQSELSKIKPFLKYVSSVTKRSKTELVFDAVISVFKYNTSIKDYFYFRFFELNDEERSKWAGTGFMYEYQLVMNPKDKRKVLEDKILFLNNYREFIKRNFTSIDDLKRGIGIAGKVFNNTSGKIVLKNSHGQVGAEVEVIRTDRYTLKELIVYMEKKGYDLVEEYVVQHPQLMELSPSGLNTVRIFTQITGNKIDFPGARLRISVNSPVDNMGAGNIAAPVDIDTGIVTGAGVYSDITKADEEIHPVTGKAIKGFKIPFWNETIEMVRKAALHDTGNRSIGWDIAITKNGPLLIEGNHNWCKLLWQLPVKKGLKKELVKYL